MVGTFKKPISINEAIKTYGGFVRYFGTNEPVRDITELIPLNPEDKVLSCCGGGDQALTLLGMLGKKGKVYAFDINPAQLFVLACKAISIKTNKSKSFNPSLDTFSREHLGRIKGLPREIKKIERLFDLKKNSFVYPSKSFKGRFGFENDYGLLPFNKDFVFWIKDPAFIQKIRTNADNLFLIHSDILYVSDWFPNSFFDAIYISDIPLHNVMPFYLERLGSLIAKLKQGGIILGNTIPGEELDRCPTIIEILKNYTTLFGLKQFGKKNTLLALKKSS